METVDKAGLLVLFVLCTQILHSSGVKASAASTFQRHKRQSGTVSIRNGGKVEVFHEGTWSHVCGNEWDNQDARVICRMLGYWHGQGTAELRQRGPLDVILVDDVRCHGNESSLENCLFDGYRHQPCPIDAVAAVNCTPAEAVTVRLAQGFGPWEGRLDVRMGGQWRPVCRQGFHDRDAQVVCRMLGLRTDGGKARTEEKFAQSLLPPLVKEMDCSGSETDITECQGKPATAGENCSNVGVECYSCGGLYTNESGTIESENYPLSYPRNINCLYVIQPANENQLYKLEFSNFSTEACCDRLKVKVFSGQSSAPGDLTFAGTVSPPDQLGQGFVLDFITDGSHSLQGFRATWSPASVKDVVAVTCQDGQLSVDVDLGSLGRLYPQSSPSTIALADPGCRGTVVNVAGTDHLVITADTDSCGTRMQTRSTSIEYSNFLVDRVYAAGSNIIVRQRRWELPIRCSVDRTEGFEVQYIPFSEVRKRDTPLLPNRQEMDNAHVRLRREVHAHLSVNLNFPVSIDAFKDRTFTALETSPLTRHLGDDIDLRVGMTGDNANLKVVLQSCYAMPGGSTGNRTTYYIIRQGCAVDATTQILDTRQHATDFRFSAFEFAGDFPSLILTCDVRVCSANDNGADCDQQCTSASTTSGSAASVHKRNAASPPLINRESNSKAHTVRFGPIYLQ